MRRPHAYSRETTEGAKLLGVEIARARRARRWTSAELAERAGISRTTLSALEHGTPTVALGVVLEVAGLVGLDLFGAEPSGLTERLEHARTRLALLPRAVRRRADIDTDF